MRILMVCLGNICRSPLAEGILQKKAVEAGLPWKVDSAGTLSYHVGEMPHRLSCEVALENDLDIRNQRARHFKQEDAFHFDIIYAMASDVLEDMKTICPDPVLMQKSKLLMDELYAGKRMDVPDPYGGTPDDFRNTYQLIEKACQAIIDKALKEINQHA